MGMHNLDKIHGDEHYADDLSSQEVNDRCDDFLSGMIVNAAEILADKLSGDECARELLFSFAAIKSTDSPAFKAVSELLFAKLNQLVKEMVEDGEF